MALITLIGGIGTIYGPLLGALFVVALENILRAQLGGSIPGGNLIVLGFNPLGPWGLRHGLARHGFPPGLDHLWSEARVSDWLRVLGFEVESVRRYLGLWPSQRLVGTAAGAMIERAGASLGRYALPAREQPGYPMPLAGAYVLTARKRVYALTRIVQARRRAPRLTPRLVRPPLSCGDGADTSTFAGPAAGPDGLPR